NEKTGEFYYCGMLESSDDPPFSGIGIIRGTFSGGGFFWDSPRVIRSILSTVQFLDKPWMVADSSSGNLYITYTEFGVNTNNIVFQRSLDEGATWSSPKTLNAASEAGNVQGSRPAVGPNGQVYVAWREFGTALAGGLDFMHFRTSLDYGTSF